ncbi:MAG: FAD/NAD(P)-binding protein [Candidatus Parcubacteria bacterium]|nr:FAD/NAD(P)-binding protein [Candidatus Parcubacteria bacterium]
MQNIYQPAWAKIKGIRNEAKNTKLFTLEFLDKKYAKDFVFTPGQIIEVGLPGFGEAPVAICSAPSASACVFAVAVRKAGQLTEQLHQLKIGNKIMIRGPFGRGFLDTPKNNVLLIAGGLGIIPLRSFILSQLNQKLGDKITIFYGAKSPDEFLFKSEFTAWHQAGVKIYLTVDKSDKNWSGEVGPVTVLFDNLGGEKATSPSKTLAILCGPSAMYDSVIARLGQSGFSEQNIYLSLERRMHCGVGICQHCAVGPKYVCKDGPVFPWSEIKNIYPVN